MLDSRYQPSLESLVQRMSEELSAKAVLLLHENGQVLQRAGWIGEEEYPAMAALVAAMLAAGRSLGGLGEAFAGSPSRFSCDSDAVGLYTVAVTPEIWLVALYEQPLNPALLRMKVRRYAETCARLGTKSPPSGEALAVPAPEKPAFSGATSLPAVPNESRIPEKITVADSSLFSNITDDEIDRLFEDAHS